MLKAFLLGERAAHAAEPAKHAVQQRVFGAGSFLLGTLLFFGGERTGFGVGSLPARSVHLTLLVDHFSGHGLAAAAKKS